MRAGELRHSLVIESVTETHNASTGWGVSESWATFATIPGSLKPVSSGERRAAQQVGDVTTHRATIRYLSGLTTAMRITHDSRTFQITGIRNVDERDRFMELTLVEQGN